MGSKLKLRYYVATLCIIGIVTRLQWFNPASVLTHSDWSYWAQSAMKQLRYGWASWLTFSGLGAPNIQIPFLGFNLVWCLLALFGQSYDTATKITFLMPVALLGLLALFFLSLKLTQNKIIALVVSLTYASTTYFLLRQTAHLPIAFVYALTPLAIFFMIKAFESGTIRAWLLFYLIVFLSLIYALRICLILIFICIVFALVIEGPKRIVSLARPILIGSGIFLLMNLFWLLPTIFGGAISTIEAVENRGLFGDQLFDLSHALALSESAWTGGTPNESFTMQPILPYLWLLPIIAILLAIFIKEFSSKNKKIIISLLLIGLVGTLLTKQSAEPFTGLYQYLYDNIPGFNLYREASKFYLLTAFSYAMLVGYAALLFASNKINWSSKKYIYSAAAAWRPILAQRKEFQGRRVIGVGDGNILVTIYHGVVNVHHLMKYQSRRKSAKIKIGALE